MLFKDSALLDRIFRVFDADDDNEIIFAEYLSCMSQISSKATKEEKLKCKFSPSKYSDNVCSTSIVHGLLARNDFCASFGHPPTSKCNCIKNVSSFVTTVSFQIYDFDGDGFIRYVQPLHDIFFALLCQSLRRVNVHHLVHLYHMLDFFGG